MPMELEWTTELQVSRNRIAEKGVDYMKLLFGRTKVRS